MDLLVSGGRRKLHRDRNQISRLLTGAFVAEIPGNYRDTNFTPQSRHHYLVPNYLVALT